MKVICLLGSTGTGKSSLANSILGKEAFKVSNDLKSETKVTEGHFSMLSTKEIKDIATIILDTPGFGDSEGRSND